MKFSMLEKPAPTWNVPVGRSPTSTLTLMRSGVAALLGRDVDALEVAERGDAASCDVSSLVSLKSCALLDLHLAADDLVARLGVALDLDALEVDERAAPDRRRRCRPRCLSGSSSVCGSASTLA